MSVIAEMKTNSSSLTVEWKRIEILALCLVESRANREPSKALIQQLTDIQHNVNFLRKESSGWQNIISLQLSELAQDILACVYAPFINPNVALLFQDLQQNNGIYPTLAFLHQLLAFTEQEYLSTLQLLDKNDLLITHNLLLIEGTGPMQQLKPHPDIITAICGLPAQDLVIPGAVKIKLDAGWNDLIIPAAQRTMLKEYLLWIQNADKVNKDWSARKVGGPIALFSGPSGTGKTFAASVIANKLDWPLYRVDLGSLISKYIGETEKNLNALFSAVHGKDILLQFDEVDALMGKRGEIKDAHDRYANMEVSHLLSRIEMHQGPCILTTNLRKQIDPAFQRRFHFVLTFPRPGKKHRLALWKSLIPPQSPIDKNLNLRQVAEAVSLSGGEIQNAAHHAAILAAAESRPITLEHITIGVWRVLQKVDGQTRPNQLRQLEDSLPKHIISAEES